MEDGVVSLFDMIAAGGDEVGGVAKCDVQLKGF